MSFTPVPASSACEHRSRQHCTTLFCKLQSLSRGGAAWRAMSILLFTLAFAGAAFAQNGKVVINDRWPIRGSKGPVLSPPHVEPTNNCSKSVYVDSFVPHATIRVFLGGTTLIGGPMATEFGFVAVQLTQQLNTGEQITATQTVNGITSAPSAAMIVGQMPSHLTAPSIDPKIFACGRVVPVHGLVPGTTVEVEDATTNTPIGSGATPNLWGSDWDPVVTSALVKGHEITAIEKACTGVASPFAPKVTVLPEPSPFLAPKLDPPIIGNDAITAHQLDTGSLLEAFQGPAIGSGFSTGETNWMHVAPPIAASPGVISQQTLCHHSPKSPPVTPTKNIPAPTLVGPICPGQSSATVRNTTINATLVLLKNGVVIGYGGAAPGDVPLDVAPPAAFVQGDVIQVVQYIGSLVVLSNKVIVGCTNAVTYHNDNLRTGWNPKENTLNTANVRPATFGLIASVTLDDQVDTQPLVVTNQLIEGRGVHTVVYVATEGNTVYAIDSWSGDVLRSVNLGAPVPSPLGCTNNGPNVGINGTPTIDLKRRTLYVIAYSLQGGKPIYELHALDLATLSDKPGSPIVVSGSHTLTDGSSYTFHADVQRQRSALLLENGNVYAAFASFCDFKPDQSRGWVLGWNANSLAPLAANEVTDTLTTSTTSYFLSSIWMSGYGVAADSQGQLFFVTGNSDWNKNTYTGTTNIQESVVKLRGDLSGVVDLFTPSNVFPLDQADADYGSGGVMLLPDQPGPLTHLAVAAGKDGRQFIINRDSMGGFHNPDIPKNVPVNACWCGPSYFKASDGIGRVVSSGGFNVKTWKVNTAASPALAPEADAPAIPTGPQGDGGFFTSISSLGTTANTAVIWAVGRPTGTDNHITLYAYDGTATSGTIPLMWSAPAGTWTSLDGNADLVPTVANGRVYVPSYKQLTIFGLRPGKRFGWPWPRWEAVMQIPEPPPQRKIKGAVYWGTIKSIDSPSRIKIELRTGKVVEVDLHEALEDGLSGPAVVGGHVAIIGKSIDDGVIKAQSMRRAKGPQTWGEDRREE